MSGLLDEMESEERQADQEKIADPRIEPRQSEMVEHVRIVNHIPQIEVQKVEAVTCFTNEDERRYPEELR